MRGFDNIFGAFRMGVGDKKLAEFFLIDHFYYFAHAKFI